MNGKFGFRKGSVAVLMICLIFTQAGLAATVNVNLNDVNQTIRGFGGMNFPRWGHGLQNDAQVDTAFGNGPGQIGLTIMRIDISPSQSDWGDTVDAAQRAISQHGAIVFASPWSPPASMKTNGSVNNGGELKTDSYGDFANWLTAFADYMSNNGAPLYAVSVQNEPDWVAGYESCIYSAEQMRTFLDSNASVIPTRVMAPERTGFNLDYLDTVAPSPECDIIAIHIYGGGGYYSYPGKEYWMTEHYTDSSTNANVWPNALGVGKEIHDCMTNNMNAYIWWYIRRFYGPMEEDGSITKRGYCMSHFAKFARPGYTRVDATANPSPDVYVTAYKNDANLVIVAVNQSSSSSDITLAVSGGLVYSYTKYQTTSDVNLMNMGSVGSTNTLAAYSINTFVGTISYEEDTNAPTPDPMTWASNPAATGDSSIEMTATTASDISGVEYYFDCLTAGGHDSSWQNGAYYEDTGLDPNTQYSYRVQARDKSPNQNVTGWSGTLSATTEPPDTTPPTPNPMTWATVPTATGPGSITMTATTASDISGVEYYFNCLTAGGHDSGWTDNPTYTDTGLVPSTSYTYRVQARDKSQNQNAAGWSNSLSATTEPPPTDIEIIGSWATSTSHTKESGYNRALIFIAHGEHPSSDMNLASVTYGGQAMTKIIELNVGTAYRAYVTAYILKEADINAATSSTFTPIWSGTSGAYAYSSVFLQNVDQTSSIGATASNSTNSGTDPISTSSALITDDGDMVFLGATCNNLGSYTVGGGFTEGAGTDQQFGDATTGGTGVAGYKAATGANETPSADYSATVGRQVIIGFVVKAAQPPEYGNCAEVIADDHRLAADIAGLGDCYVDFDDLCTFADNWLRQDCTSPDNCGGADFDPTDGVVDFVDFGDFAEQWLTCNDPTNPGCSHNW